MQKGYVMGESICVGNFQVNKLQLFKHFTEHLQEQWHSWSVLFSRDVQVCVILINKALFVPARQTLHLGISEAVTMIQCRLIQSRAVMHIHQTCRYLHCDKNDKTLNISANFFVLFYLGCADINYKYINILHDQFLEIINLKATFSLQYSIDF